LQQIGWRQRTFYAEKYAFGSIIERGYIKVQRADGDKIQVYFTQNLAEIFGINQKTLLSDLDLGFEGLPLSFVANANHLTDKYALPQIQNSAFYGTNNASNYNGIVNEYGSSNYQNSTKVPMLFNRFVLEKLSQVTGLSFFGDFVNDADYQRLLIYNSFSLDQANTIVYSNHLPGLTVEQYFLELKKLFNLVMRFDVKARTLSMNFVDNALVKPCILDWSSKVAPIRNKNPEQTQAIELELGLNSSDALTKIPNPDFDRYRGQIRAGAPANYQSVKTAWSSLTTAASGLPTTESAGISPHFNQQTNKFSPQFLFWHGMVAGKPKALNHYGGSRLAFFGNNNLHGKHWQNYEQWRAQTFMCNAEAYLTAADVVTFDPSEKVHINGVNYYVDEMKLQLQNRKSTFVKANLSLYRA
jgi:hypothetical protein